MNATMDSTTGDAANDRPRSPSEDLAGCRAYTPALARSPETNRFMNQNQWRTR